MSSCNVGGRHVSYSCTRQCYYFWQPACLADRFVGRTVEITDGRRDLTHWRHIAWQCVGQAPRLWCFYPTWVSRRWNDGRRARNETDDVGYITALINEFIVNCLVDPRRVFLTGHSNGGDMAMRRSCYLPELIQGIAVVATKSPTRYQCGQGHPVPAFIVHGTEDLIAPNGGGPERSRLGGALSSEATIEPWKRRNRCKGCARVETIDRKNDGTSAKIFQFSRCTATLWCV